MTWEEFLCTPIDTNNSGQVKTNILCPECLSHYIYLDKTVVLTSYPAKYYYWCPCGWTGFAPAKWCGDSNE